MLRRQKYLNFVVLICSFGIGQGSLFLAQSYLVARENLHLLAQFGTSFSVLMLMMLIVDFGCSTLLAKTAATETDAEIAKQFTFSLIIRGTVALVILAAIFVFSRTVDGDVFFKTYAAYSSLGLIFWTSNCTGILDGKRLSAISGLSSTFPYLFSAAALAYSSTYHRDLSAQITGLALSCGYASTVSVQIFYLAARKIMPKISPIEITDLRHVVASAGSNLASIVSPQVYFRVQLILSTIFLPAQVTGLLVYTKQITASASQLSALLRRVGFPDLVHLMRDGGGSLRAVVSLQKGSILIALGGALTAVCAGLFLYSTQTGAISDAGKSIALFGPAIALEAIALALTQALTAAGRFHVAALATAGALACGLAFNYITLKVSGIGSFMIADAVSYCVLIGLAAMQIKSSRTHAASK